MRLRRQWHLARSLLYAILGLVSALSFAAIALSYNQTIFNLLRTDFNKSRELRTRDWPFQVWWGEGGLLLQQLLPQGQTLRLDPLPRNAIAGRIEFREHRRIFIGLENAHLRLAMVSPSLRNIADDPIFYRIGNSYAAGYYIYEEQLNGGDDSYYAVQNQTRGFDHSNSVQAQKPRFEYTQQHWAGIYSVRFSLWPIAILTGLPAAIALFAVRFDAGDGADAANVRNAVMTSLATHPESAPNAARGSGQSL